MEAFSESILKLDNLNDRRFVINSNVATQGDGKTVRDYLKALSKACKAKDEAVNEAEDFLLAFQKGFKGID